MIPGRRTCPPTWTMEYEGYLMNANDKTHRSSFICVDSDPEPATTGAVPVGVVSLLMTNIFSLMICFQIIHNQPEARSSLLFLVHAPELDWVIVRLIYMLQK